MGLLQGQGLLERLKVERCLHYRKPAIDNAVLQYTTEGIMI